ncbi:unnamed protein product [Tetraodon nigroviridis]|uniref:(spotted green pufferfish) hypothetical protein n=1 Tax=Tetraodon nigroviridis TaxID=99883 RepID=Q4SGT9_TETNG|nr:unnamed protein product [Tetraodon nigroviridis]
MGTKSSVPPKDPDTGSAREDEVVGAITGSVSKGGAGALSPEMLASLQSLRDNTDSTLLPHSLHQVAETFWAKEDCILLFLPPRCCPERPQSLVVVHASTQSPEGSRAALSSCCVFAVTLTTTSGPPPHQWAIQFLQLEKLYHERLLSNLAALQENWGTAEPLLDT